MNKTNCTQGNLIKTVKKRKVVNTNGTSGCLYITNVNLYLHPNAGSNGTQTNSDTSEISKIKTRCNSPECFYYDCDLCGDEDFYCCNPVCPCFRPDWYYCL